MTDLVTFKGNSISTPASGVSNLFTELLSSIPSALARPLLEYQRTKEEARLVELAIKAKQVERVEILKTIRVLAENGQLTPEISQTLLCSYYQAPIYYPN